MQNKERTEVHRRNTDLETCLKNLEQMLSGTDRNIKPREDLPIIFIMGNARSGSTLLTQALAAATDWTYPTNLISRFYYSPYIGAQIQRLLFDLDFKGELFGDVKRNIDFSSKLGKTPGALSPHEFWYFWRRFFNFLPDFQKVDYGVLTEAEKQGFVHGLRSLQEVFQKPLFLKGMLLNWDIDLLAELFPNAFFIHLERSITANADSLLRARQNFFGDEKKWYSFKPKEYSELIRLSVREQIIGQVFYTNEAIKQQLGRIAPEKSIRISYEAFCEDPQKVLESILERSTIASNEELDNLLPEGFSVREIDSEPWKNALNYFGI